MKIRLAVTAISAAIGMLLPSAGVPAAAGTATSAPSPAGVTQPSVVVSGTARCDAVTGTWRVSWGYSAWSAGVSLESVRDEVNGQTYDMPATPLVVQAGLTKGVGVMVLAGTASVATMTATFATPVGAAPLTRRMVLPGECVRQETPACVPLADARFRHYTDPASGVVTVEVVGAPACTGAAIVYMDQAQRLDGSYGTYNFIWPLVGLAESRYYTKVAMLLDPAPCASRRYLSMGAAWSGSPMANELLGATGAPGSRSAGPVIAEVTYGPPCIAATVRFASTYVRTGARTSAPAIQVTVANGEDAALPAAFAVSYVRAGAWVTTWYETAPGGTTLVTLDPEMLSVTVALAFKQDQFDSGFTYEWSAPPAPPRRPTGSRGR